MQSMVMKNYIGCFLLMISSLLSWSQGRIIKTSIPCSDEILFKTPGKWFKYTDLWQVDHIAFNKLQQQEVSNRIDKIHTMMQNIYPEPMGVDVAWMRTLGFSTFGDQVTYIRTDEFSLDRKTVVERPVASFGYVAGFFRHFCAADNKNEIRPGYPGETGTWLTINTNSFNGFAIEYFGNEDTLTIGGYPVHLRQPLKQKFDGYEVYFSKAVVDNPQVSPQFFVLIHRKGELPYIPVTRKQYLEKCINYLPKFFDKMIKGFEQMPVSTVADQQTWNDQLADLKKNKETVLKRYTDELEEIIKQGLSDSPAIIPLTIYNIDEHSPIFVEEDKGFMIVRVNPKYMRTDIPKYIPQFFTMVMTWNEWPPQADVGKLMEGKFPFAQLQAMIDK